ncbi:MAG: 4Fe-4S binding protein [Candidatus Hadarchaeia archaeon]
MLDCDVEEPDCHLFLDTDLREVEKVTSPNPKINSEKCDLCGKCAEVCRFNAMVVTPEEVMIFPELCHSCGICKLACPRDAITEEEKLIGRIEHSDMAIDFYHGILETGELLAAPVIESVKSYANQEKT